ncbi:MAG TPA: isoleucine--tRNA ligase [Candidatus Eisenbacteria bacterium]|nr:isoleucine--tRNA ligase [Candidatus Eisenbacteria bacterium]
MNERRYRAVPPQVDLPAMERDILAFWHEHDTFAKSLARTEGGDPWTFYEGPPTANGTPGVHHVEARVFKDVFPRFKTMQGYHVDRKAGWDCHGLPVEIAVEKELGFSGKGDIEAYGVAEFNAKCRESVLRHVDEFETMTRRMGYWVDMSEAYWTMDPGYVESVWWSLKQVFDQGLLVQDHRVAPYCPRCGTGLSDHELAQGYETVVDPSVYVRFPLTSGPYAGQAALLVWTTTPWTLVSNTAVAVHPDVTYVTASNGEETFVVAEPLVEAALGEGWTVGDRFTGRDMERWTYQRPFELVDWPAGEQGHFVVLGDYVTTDDGTGLVHQSPAFGAEDLAVCKTYGLPVVNPVRPDGHFEDGVRLVGGQFFKSADKALVDDLKARGLLFRHMAYEHSYPHCWRCHTALIYYAQPSWYIRTTAVKDALLAENERTNWFPDNIKWGRYGDWLNNNIDWALSRSRFWGTPLPVWRCEVDPTHLTCVGSLAELGALAGQDLSALDPHRPYVDDVTLPCPVKGDDGEPCGQPASRVSEVIDAWYDSGSMPFAQWGYPHAAGSKERFDAAFPAQFICEAIDQTRGWFYTLMAVNTIVHGRSSYENVLCLGLLIAEDGRKMSKHLGNVLMPIPLMDEHGADALRWFMAASGSPWQTRRVGDAALQEIVRKTLLTYWNTASFLTLYGNANDWSPLDAPAPAVADRPLLDRWLLSETHRLVRDVTAAYEAFDTQRAGRLLADHVDTLSNWYVRRSRRRFWDGDPSALATLHEALHLVTLLLAPVVPFVTERVWQDVVRPVWPDAPESVHLATWPQADESLVDDTLADQVALVRRVVELGRAARAESKVRNRQPLGRALVGAPAWRGLPDELQQHVADELNVVAFEDLAGELVDHSAKGNVRALGKRFGKDTPKVAAAVAAADAATLAAALRDSGTATVTVDGEQVALGPDEVIVTETPREGWAVVTEGGETVALDLTITPALRRAGLAREAVRLVQEARKSSGFEVTDRIALRWQAAGDLADTLREHAGVVAAEVLATSYDEGPAAADQPVHRDEELGLAFTLTRSEQ